MNKVRIIALYIQHRDGVPDEDRRRLYQHAHLTTAEQDAWMSLHYRMAQVGWAAHALAFGKSAITAQ